jgi:hypothetical protein
MRNGFDWRDSSHLASPASRSNWGAIQDLVYAFRRRFRNSDGLRLLVLAQLAFCATEIHLRVGERACDLLLTGWGIDCVFLLRRF